MPKKRKAEPLVYAYLEGGSRALLEHHPDIVRRRIGKNSGIYALYKAGKLYYVGLATSLSNRLKAHLRDGHWDKWDQFSVYLTIKAQHIRELETLLLRIAKPKGNSISGNPDGSHDLDRDVRVDVKAKQQREFAKIVGGGLAARKAPLADQGASSALTKLFPNGATLRSVSKANPRSARIRRDGMVRVDGQLFKSLSLAAKHVAGHYRNGWRYWLVERGAGHWVRIDEVKRAGTPLLKAKKSRTSAKRSATRKEATKDILAKRSETARKAWATRRARGV